MQGEILGKGDGRNVFQKSWRLSVNDWWAVVLSVLFLKTFIQLLLTPPLFLLLLMCFNPHTPSTFQHWGPVHRTALHPPLPSPFQLPAHPPHVPHILSLFHSGFYLLRQMNDIMIINRAGGGKGKFNSVVLLLSPEVHAQLQRMYVGLAPFKTNSRSTLLEI